ncbi:hypothetical protein CaCOL14_004845 [Colletotrichum acutatum]
MDGLLRTLTRSRNTAPSPNRGSRNRNRHSGGSGGGGGNNHGQIEIIIETLARGLVEYAVQKYMKKLSGGGDEDKSGGGHKNDGRLSTRNTHGRDDNERARGGVPNMDMEMLEHLGKNILSKAMERFGGGGGEEYEEEDARRRHGKGQRGSRDRDSYSRGHSQDRSHGRRHGGGGGKDEDHTRDRRRRHSRDDGYPSHRPGLPSSPSRHHRGDEENSHRRRRRGYGTDYTPLKEEMETLSNTLISLNERQPGHADCEFYDAFVERSGKVQEAIGSVLVQIREREERREERRGRRRG